MKPKDMFYLKNKIFYIGNNSSTKYIYKCKSILTQVASEKPYFKTSRKKNLNIMKNLITLLFIFITLNGLAQFQQDMQSDVHFSDLNTLYLQDSSGDYIVAGSKFDNIYNNSKLTLTRIDEVSGAIVWTKVYEDVLFTNFRGFDIDRYNDGEEKIALTGSVKIDLTGYNNTIIAVFEAINGNLLTARTFAGSGNHANSQGLNIIYTETMINMMPMPGFVIAGFMNDMYDNDMAQSNIGFAMRVDENLLPIWTRTFDNDFLMGVDYDVVNNITETNDGYFLTGARSKALSIPPFNFQAVMAMKVDFYGDFVWETSYIHNNANGIGADAKYDAAEDKIYLLANYDSNQFFGVTVLSNITGTVASNSWYGQEATTQGWFGFELSRSFDPNNLVVHGYKNYNELLNSDDVLTAVRTTPFAYEFQKNTGAQVKTIQYEVLYETPALMNDFFYFWNTDIPKTYFPDMAFISPSADMNYFTVGLRTQDDFDTKMEMIQTDNFLDNECNSSLYDITVNPISIFSFEETLQNAFSPFNDIDFVASIPSYNIASCETGGYIIDPSTGITDFESHALSIYPNPANDVLTISLETEIQSIAILNILGAQVMHAENSKLNISHLTAGIYMIRVQAISGKAYTSKFTKE
jgi:hypothetical protein